MRLNTEKNSVIYYKLQKGKSECMQQQRRVKIRVHAVGEQLKV